MKNLLKIILLIPFMFGMVANAQNYFVADQAFLGADFGHCGFTDYQVAFTPGTVAQPENPDHFKIIWSTGDTVGVLYHSFGSTPGYYSIWCQVTSADGTQVASDTLNVTIYPNVPTPVIAISGTGCVDSSTLSVPLQTGYSYQWSQADPNGYYNDITGQTGNALFVTQTNSYQVKVTNSEGCFSYGGTSISTLGKPKKYLHDTALCETTGQPSFSISDNVNTNCSYLWDSGNTNSAFTINPNIVQSNTNTVVITNQNGCSIVDSITWAIRALPEPLIQDSVYTCAGTNITLKDSSNHGYTHVWNNASGTIGTSDSVTINAIGNYNVEVTNQYGCAITKSISVLSSPMVEVGGFNFIPQILDNPQTFYFASLDVENATKYLWNFGDGVTSTEITPTHTYQDNIDSALVTLTVTNNTYIGDCGTKTVSQMISTKEQATGINEIGNGTLLSVYPNPTKDIIHISCNDFVAASIMNVNGTVIKKSKEKDINILSIADGVYIIKIETNNGYVFKKIKKY